MDIFERLKQNAGGSDRPIPEAEPRLLLIPRSSRAKSGPHMIFRGQRGAELEPQQLPRAWPTIRRCARPTPTGGRRVRHGRSHGRPHDERADQVPRAARAPSWPQFVGKPDAFLLNYGYQGMISIIDSPADAPRRRGLRLRGARLHHRRAAACTRASASSIRTTTWKPAAWQLAHAHETGRRRPAAACSSSPRACSA